jgi:hypothetical protein
MAKQTGLGNVPAGLIRPTTQREPEPAPVEEPELVEAEQGGASVLPIEEPRPARATRARRKASAASSEPAGNGGRRLYLSDEVMFRLRMTAYKKGVSLSEVAEELLSKNLPKWNVERVG